jgi:hypothetical protein
MTPSRPGVADLDDPALKERIASLKAIRDQAQADADRAQAMAESVGQQAITPAMVQKYARTARERIRIDGGGYRREHAVTYIRRTVSTQERLVGSSWTVASLRAARVEQDEGVRQGSPLEDGMRSPESDSMSSMID